MLLTLVITQIEVITRINDILESASTDKAENKGDLHDVTKYSVQDDFVHLMSDRQHRSFGH